jgi:lauroyl/myristoyl acyltransferase
MSSVSDAKPSQPQALPVTGLRRVLGPFYTTGAFWFWFATMAPRYLPGFLFVPVETFFGVLFTGFLGRSRNAIQHNLVPVLGPCGFWAGQVRALRTLVNFARCFGDRYERLVRGSRFSVEVSGREHWEAAGEGGRGILLVTAHVGAWDAMSQLAPAGLNRVLHVVREEEMDASSQEFIRRLVREQGAPDCVTHFASDDPTLGLKLKQALERGEIVALQGDRPRAGGRSVVAHIFSQEIDLPNGPAALARLAGVALLPVFCFREGHYRHRIAFRPPIHVAPDPGPGPIEEATRALARNIEWAIRERPHQWFALAQAFGTRSRAE